MRRNVLFTARLMLFTSVFMYTCCGSSRHSVAHALGDPSVTVEQGTPSILSSGALFPTEVVKSVHKRIVQLFENNIYAVVNIFYVTLRPQLNVTGVVEVPEGNGSGIVWDEQGHIVTNYHVIGNSLSRNPSPGQVVARVNILTSEGVQKNFEGKLIGADRSKDLAVLKVVPGGFNVDIAPDLVANQLNVRNGVLILLINSVPGNSLADRTGQDFFQRQGDSPVILYLATSLWQWTTNLSKAQLYKALDDYNAGDKVVLKIQRGDENLELQNFGGNEFLKMVH